MLRGPHALPLESAARGVIQRTTSPAAQRLRRAATEELKRTMKSLNLFDPKLLASLSMAPAPLDDESALRDVLREVDPIARRSASVNVDVQVPGRRLRRVLARIRRDARLYEGFKLLAAVGIFDFEVLNRLQRAAPALWLVGHRAKLERARGARTVDAATVERGVFVREEMARIARHLFGRDPIEAPAVNDLDNGNDHLRLANHLRYLHDLFVRHEARVARDVFYDATHVADAKRIGDLLRDALDGRESDEVRWVDRAAALWANARADYAELQQVGRFLLRATPDLAKETFPALVKGGPGRGKRAVEDDAADEEAVDDAPPPANEAEKPAEEKAAPVVAAPAEGRAETPAEKPAVVKAGAKAKKRAKTG